MANPLLDRFTKSAQAFTRPVAATAPVVDGALPFDAANADEYPGVIVSYPYSIDEPASGYDGPTRPAMVREDDAGWTGG